MKKSTIILLAAAVLAAIPLVVYALPLSTFEGKPTYTAGGNTGAYIWYDNGFVARFTTKEKERTFTGKICADAISGLEPNHVDSNASNTVSIGADAKCLAFSLKVDKTLVGFSWKAQGAKVTFDIKMDGSTLNNDRIWLGKSNTNPPANPFELNR